MKYQVIYDAATKIEMTKEEVQRFLLELQKQDIVEFKGNFLTKFFRVITEVEQIDGRLHDGTKVIKLNGQWRDAGDPSLRLDTAYYPEIASDTVMGEEEWQYQKNKLLNSQQLYGQPKNSLSHTNT